MKYALVAFMICVIFASAFQKDTKEDRHTVLMGNVYLDEQPAYGCTVIINLITLQKPGFCDTCIAGIFDWTYEFYGIPQGNYYVQGHDNGYNSPVYRVYVGNDQHVQQDIYIVSNPKSK